MLAWMERLLKGERLPDDVASFNVWLRAANVPEPCNTTMDELSAYSVLYYTACRLGERTSDPEPLHVEAAFKLLLPTCTVVCAEGCKERLKVRFEGTDYSFTNRFYQWREGPREWLGQQHIGGFILTRWAYCPKQPTMSVAEVDALITKFESGA